MCLKTADDEVRKLGIEQHANRDEIAALREEVSKLKVAEKPFLSMMAVQVRTLVQCTPTLLAPDRTAVNARFPIDLRWSLTLLPFSLHLQLLDKAGVAARRSIACVCRTLAGVVMLGRCVLSRLTPIRLDASFNEHLIW